MNVLITGANGYIGRALTDRLLALRRLPDGRPIDSLTLFDHTDMHAHVARLLAERPISAVFVYSGQMAQYVPILPAGIRFIMDWSDYRSSR